MAKSSVDRHRLLLVLFFPSAPTHLPDSIALHVTFCFRNISEMKLYLTRAGPIVYCLNKTYFIPKLIVIVNAFSELTTSDRNAFMKTD